MLQRMLNRPLTIQESRCLELIAPQWLIKHYRLEPLARICMDMEQTFVERTEGLERVDEACWMSVRLLAEA